IWASAYQAHPYHHPTIGWRSDIEHVSIERLKKFYDTFYWPNNATVTIIGDIDRTNTLVLVKKYFGVHKRAPHEIPEVYTKEPRQQGQRRVRVERQGQTNIVGVAHKTPEGAHEDTHALLVLSQLLGGSKGSRLYRSLVDKGLATDVSVSEHPFRDPGLFITYVFLTPGTTHEKIENVLLREYEKIKQGEISSSELNRAKAQLQSSILFARDGSYAMAGSLNEALAIGDWTFFTNLPAKIGSVTAKHIKEVARKYLTDNQSTIGYFVAK
ncbi:MAG: insulinase family protein, partial [Patescibacteria group bacterium]|nr:insulinase family protein [Patescibacteria group bacterium]